LQRRDGGQLYSRGFAVLNMQMMPKTEAEILIEQYETAKKRLTNQDFSSEDEEDELVKVVVMYSLELVCLGYQMLDKCWVHPTEAN
jgi:hypothetical protein